MPLEESSRNHRWIEHVIMGTGVHSSGSLVQNSTYLGSPGVAEFRAPCAGPQEANHRLRFDMARGFVTLK
jgi:hypothetical protein